MKTKTVQALLLFIIITLASCSQKPDPLLLQIELNEIQIKDAPALNSFAFATHQGQWLMIGGRTDGLHDHRPDRAYPADKSNTTIFVIDPDQAKTWSKTLEGLPVDLFEQLQSTNMAFYQDGDRLLLAGGYGWSEQTQDYRTFPFLTVINIPDLFQAVKNDTDITGCFHQIQDQRMAVAGGYLGKIAVEYFLVFGNRFDGRYSARPGDGHTQEYTNEIRKFTLDTAAQQISISNYSAIRDTAHFHRRDFNMLPQIFPDGEFGYTVFSGVFQYERNFPWLYPVNIFADGYEAIENFDQQFSHYHSACVSIYHGEDKQMDNMFFGGMARFVPNPESGEITNDPLVPSVKTISQVSRLANGEMKELVLETAMPGLLGASANFIPAKGLPLLHHKIVDIDKLPTGKTHIGYIYGGLESSHPNIFLQPQGTSNSTNRIFEVYLVKP